MKFYLLLISIFFPYICHTQTVCNKLCSDTKKSSHAVLKTSVIDNLLSSKQKNKINKPALSINWRRNTNEEGFRFSDKSANKNNALLSKPVFCNFLTQAGVFSINSEMESQLPISLTDTSEKTWSLITVQDEQNDLFSLSFFGKIINNEGKGQLYIFNNFLESNFLMNNTENIEVRRHMMNEGGMHATRKTAGNYNYFSKYVYKDFELYRDNNTQASSTGAYSHTITLKQLPASKSIRVSVFDKN